jgi:hypothetical protein
MFISEEKIGNHMFMMVKGKAIPATGCGGP